MRLRGSGRIQVSESSDGYNVSQPTNGRSSAASQSLKTVLILLVIFGSIRAAVFVGRPAMAIATPVKKADIDCAEMLESGNETTTVVGWVRPLATYAHIHMAKTAGTTINGYLAAHFERVCGHKGNSYDAVQFNKQIATSRGKDLVAKNRNGFNRGRVPYEITENMGFEDCDYISMEAQAHWWIETSQRWQNLEMHLPCRDPIDHINSQCNQLRRSFDCNVPPEEAIKKCLVGMNRFHRNMTLQPNTNVKCFDYANFSGYLEYMSTILQRRRIQSEYVHRSMNQARKKGSECLSERPELMAQVNQILVEKYDYYNYCNECLGSENDLLSGFGSAA